MRREFDRRSFLAGSLSATVLALSPPIHAKTEDSTPGHSPALKGLGRKFSFAILADPQVGHGDDKNPVAANARRTLTEAVRLTNEANRHWKRFLSFAAHRPSGITAFDTFVHMAPYITSFRGTPERVEHMKLLADETEEQVRRGEFPVPNERYRLLWDTAEPTLLTRPTISCPGTIG